MVGVFVFFVCLARMWSGLIFLRAWVLVWCMGSQISVLAGKAGAKA